MTFVISLHFCSEISYGQYSGWITVSRITIEKTEVGFHSNLSMNRIVVWEAQPPRDQGFLFRCTALRIRHAASAAGKRAANLPKMTSAIRSK